MLFTAGDKVEVTDEWMIAKARGNRFFKVEDSNGKASAAGNVDRRSARRHLPLDDPPRYPATPPDYPPEDDPSASPKSGAAGRRA